MSTSEITAEVVQDFISRIDAPSFTIFAPSEGGNRWGATTYWPKGDILRDEGCHGRGTSLEAAINDMWAKVEKAKLTKKKLKTAAECKDAVLALIREHDAAPASFRDAVDDLPVA